MSSEAVSRQIGTAVPPGVGSHCASGDLQAPAVQNGSIGCPPVSVAVRQEVRPMQSAMLSHEEYMPSSGCSLGGSPELEPPPEELAVSVAGEVEVPSPGASVPAELSGSVSESSPEPEVVVAFAVVLAVAVALAVAEPLEPNVVAVVAGSSPDAQPIQRPASSHALRFTP